MDFWWDGQGVGSCWQPPVEGSEPMVLPRCGADHRPAGLGTARYVAEPGKVLKLYVCTGYDQRARSIPTDCDWFGAHGLQRIEVKYALGEAVLLGLALLALWWRVLRGSRRAAIGLLVALAGVAVGVFGTAYETTPLTAIGLTLLGLGWLGVGVGLRRRGLAVVTIAAAVFALLGGVDRGLVMLPWIPVPPSVPRILLELAWVPWAVVAAIRPTADRRDAAVDRSAELTTSSAA
jgi:hypothetical protein